jgi:hypothetical protein
VKNITPIDRRQFIKQASGLFTAAFATFLILPSATTYERIWRSLLRKPETFSVPIGCRDFADFLCRITPEYDRLIMKDIKPLDGWIGIVPTDYWGLLEKRS